MSRVGFIFALALLGLCHALNFCKMPGCQELPHLGCNNSLVFHSSCLRYRVLVNMEIYKEYLIKMHNKYRNEVASGVIIGVSEAIHMPEMMWHSKLALLAEYHVKRCTESLKSYCTALPSFPNPAVNYGLNELDIRSQPDYRAKILSENILLQTEQWMHQVYKLDDSEHNYDKFPALINILNENNFYVGCAAAEYYDLNWSRFLLICYYDEILNGTQQIYETGPFDEDLCPLGVSEIYPYLCKPHKEVED